jgi:hypothetical protein
MIFLNIRNDERFARLGDGPDKALPYFERLDTFVGDLTE